MIRSNSREVVIFPNDHTETSYLFLTNVSQTAYKSYDSYAVFFPIDSKAFNSEENANIYLSNDSYLKLTQDGDKDYLPSKLRETFSAMPQNYFSLEKTSFEAASIFRSFGIEGIDVYFTADESILFELFWNDYYFSLELFNDGDIVYLRRKGSDEPTAYDISSNELYMTINSIYDSIAY